MTAQPAEEPIRQSVTVGVSVEQAFAAFADLARWWPREYTWAADTLETSASTLARAGSASSAAPTASPATGAET